MVVVASGCLVPDPAIWVAASSIADVGCGTGVSVDGRVGSGSDTNDVAVASTAGEITVGLATL